jgi:hypothetical protein
VLQEIRETQEFCESKIPNIILSYISFDWSKMSGKVSAVHRQEEVRHIAGDTSMSLDD